MSTSQSARSRGLRSLGPRGDSDDGPSTSGKSRERSTVFPGLSGMSMPGKGKRSKADLQALGEATRQEAPGTELARLLGSRTRALMLFQKPGFDPAAFVDDFFKPLSEKAADNGRHDLGALLSACGEEVEAVVREHHQRFLAACRGVEALEDQVALLRNYANGLAALLGSLKAASRGQLCAAGLGGGGASALSLAASGASFSSSVASGAEAGDSGGAEAGGAGMVLLIERQLEELLQELDVAVALRDLGAARAVLAACNDALAVLDRDASILALEVADFPNWHHQFEAAIGRRKQELARALERQLADANASAPEIRSAARALGDLLGDAHAASAMLHCYSQKIRAQQQLLLKQHASGGVDPDSLECAGSLVQRCLLAIGSAADDLTLIFGAESLEVSPLFTVWAVREVRSCTAQVKRSAMAATAASGTGLATTMQVVSMALMFCSALEHSHQISLTAAVSTELWPAVEAGLKRHLKRFTDELRMAATEEVGQLVVALLTGGLRRRGAPDAPPAVTLVTGGTLTGELRWLGGMLAAMAGARLAAALRKGVHDMFSAYTQAIGFALRSHLMSSPAGAAQLQPLVPAIMESLAGLIEEGIPDALAAFTLLAGPIVDGKQLDRALHAMYRECQAGTRAAKQQETQQTQQQTQQPSSEGGGA